MCLHIYIIGAEALMGNHDAPFAGVQNEALGAPAHDALHRPVRPPRELGQHDQFAPQIGRRAGFQDRDQLVA